MKNDTLSFMNQHVLQLRRCYFAKTGTLFFEANIFLNSVCSFPLGANNYQLGNESFSASSFNLESKPWAARLNRVVGSGAWCAENNAIGEYLEIDLVQKLHVTGIATQGEHAQRGNWVTEYTLWYRQHGNSPLAPYTASETTKV